MNKIKSFCFHREELWPQVVIARNLCDFCLCPSSYKQFARVPKAKHNESIIQQQQQARSMCGSKTCWMSHTRSSEWNHNKKSALESSFSVTLPFSLASVNHLALASNNSIQKRERKRTKEARNVDALFCGLMLSSRRANWIVCARDEKKTKKKKKNESESTFCMLSFLLSHWKGCQSHWALGYEKKEREKKCWFQIFFSFSLALTLDKKYFSSIFSSFAPNNYRLRAKKSSLQPTKDAFFASWYLACLFKLRNSLSFYLSACAATAGAHTKIGLAPKWSWMILHLFARMLQPVAVLVCLLSLCVCIDCAQFIVHCALRERELKQKQAGN